MQILAQLKALDRQSLHKVAPLILFVFITYLCWKLAALFWLLFAPPQYVNFVPVELGSQQVAVPNISHFALFKEQGQSAAGMDDNLAISLQGVMLSQPAQFSSAVIKLNDVSERYRIGETIAGSAYQLTEVKWDAVSLRHANGSTRKLSFQGLPNGLNPPEDGGTETSNSTADNSSNGNNHSDQQLEQASQRLEENRDQYLKDMGLNSAQGGLEISSRTPAILRQKLSLQPGDRILSLNGQRIGAGQTEAQILEQARQQGHARLEIKRGDQMMTIQQDLK